MILEYTVKAISWCVFKQTHGLAQENQTLEMLNERTIYNATHEIYTPSVLFIDCPIGRIAVLLGVNT